MPSRFVSERIEVETSGTIRQPESFTWRGREYSIAEVVLSWADWGFPSGSSQRDWKGRRHRNYYRVRTDTGELFEIYSDRGAAAGGGEWYLFQQLDAGE